ncbi:unnamed protein product [Caenorhabditis brenneri]
MQPKKFVGTKWKEYMPKDMQVLKIKFGNSICLEAHFPSEKQTFRSNLNFVAPELWRSSLMTHFLMDNEDFNNWYKSSERPDPDALKNLTEFMSHFNNKKIYLRSIPCIYDDSFQVQALELLEIIPLVLKQQGNPLADDDPKLQYYRGIVTTHPFFHATQLKQILEDFDIDAERITVVPDVMYQDGIRNFYKRGMFYVGFRDFNGTIMIEKSNAVLNIIQSLICGLNWRETYCSGGMNCYNDYRSKVTGLIQFVENYKSTFVPYGQVLKGIQSAQSHCTFVFQLPIPKPDCWLANALPVSGVSWQIYQAVCNHFEIPQFSVPHYITPPVWLVRFLWIYGWMAVFFSGDEWNKRGYLDLAIINLVPVDQRSKWSNFRKTNDLQNPFPSLQLYREEPAVLVVEEPVVEEPAPISSDTPDTSSSPDTSKTSKTKKKSKKNKKTTEKLVPECQKCEQNEKKVEFLEKDVPRMQKQMEELKRKMQEANNYRTDERLYKEAAEKKAAIYEEKALKTIEMGKKLNEKDKVLRSKNKEIEALKKQVAALKTHSEQNEQLRKKISDRKVIEDQLRASKQQLTAKNQSLETESQLIKKQVGAMTTSKIVQNNENCALKIANKDNESFKKEEMKLRLHLSKKHEAFLKSERLVQSLQDSQAQLVRQLKDKEQENLILKNTSSRPIHDLRPSAIRITQQLENLRKMKDDFERNTILEEAQSKMDRLEDLPGATVETLETAENELIRLQNSIPDYKEILELNVKIFEKTHDVSRILDLPEHPKVSDEFCDLYSKHFPVIPPVAGLPDTDCPICYDTRLPGQQTLACDNDRCPYIFHVSCLREWFKDKPAWTVCPQCQQPLRDPEQYPVLQ